MSKINKAAAVGIAPSKAAAAIATTIAVEVTRVAVVAVVGLAAG